MSAELLRMQAPKGVPRSDFFQTVTDPLIPPSRTSEMLAHFHESVYDLRPESHLSRLLKVLLGDAGAGQLRKRYTYAHLSQFIATAHYNDLDQFFAGVFGLKRLVREKVDSTAYQDAHTDEEWEAINAADASYRARLLAFTSALSMAGTPSGMAMAASAVLGSECRVYETYQFLEMGEEPPFESRVSPEGGRSEFVIRPMREISSEEEMHLVTVLGRIKPAEALLTIDTTFAEAFIPVTVTRSSASSSYWHVQRRVLIDPQSAPLYRRYTEKVPTEQPRLPFSHYQGEAWNYNDVSTATSYAEDSNGRVIQDTNFDRHVAPNGMANNYEPSRALTDPDRVLRGRQVSDGILVSAMASRGAV